MPAPIDPIPIKNASAEAIPSFAVVEPTGTITEGALEVDQPTATGNRNVLVNGPAMIPAGGTGQAFAFPRVVVAYDPEEGAPAAGDEWGAVINSWRLGLNAGGFLIIGGAGGGAVNAVRYGGSGAGGTTTAADCRILWDLKTDNCLLATTAAGTGRCADIAAQTHNLTWDGTLERWVSPVGDPHVVDTGSGRLYFWVDDTATPPRPRLQLVGNDFSPSYEFDWLPPCFDGAFRFIGRGTDVCDGTQTGGCVSNVFVVDISCESNTNSGWTTSGWYCVAVTGCDTGTETQVCVEYTTDPGCGVVICGGPHADEATCEAACREVATGDGCTHCDGVTPAEYDTSAIAGTTSSKGCTDCETVNSTWTLTQDAKNPCLWAVEFDAGDQDVSLTRAATSWTLAYNNGACNSGWTSTIDASDSCLEELVFSDFTQTGTLLCSVPSGPITVTPSLA